MTRSGSIFALACCLLLTWVGSGRAALTAAQRCQAAKLTAAGKDAACQARALAKAALGGVNTVSQCDAKLTAVFTKLEAKGGCSTTNDAPTTAARIDLSSIRVQASFFYPGVPGVPTNGFNFTDNGDGTVTDNNTGLQWEQKTFPGGGVHYAGNFYTWSSTGCIYTTVNGFVYGSNGTAPDGTVFTTFLAALNNDAAPGCFAGHCDWRLPTVLEWETIIDPKTPLCDQNFICTGASAPYTCCTGPGTGSCNEGFQCINDIFGDGLILNWSSQTDPADPTQAAFFSTVINDKSPPIHFMAGYAEKCANALGNILIPIGPSWDSFGARAVRTAKAPTCGSSLGQSCCGSGVCYVGTCSAGGTCVCPAGLVDCFGTCVDILTNANNCGGCGHVCTTLPVCLNGMCIIP